MPKVATLAAPKMAQDATELVISGDLSPYTGPWGREQAAHLLRRITFGVKKDQLDALLAIGNAADAIEAVLTVPGLPAPPVNNYNSTEFTDPDVPFGQPWLDAAPNVTAEPYRMESWRGWWMERILDGGPNIQEKMVLFWHNHFATQSSAVFIAKAVYQHNQLLRQYALGNFKALVRAVTIDAAMLYYLNGYLNDKSAPDENYARELQELFTIGKDSPDHYTEDDVVAAARVLTGWRVNYFNSDVFFWPLSHDTGPKQFSGFYNNTVIAGNSDGNIELDALLDMIFQKEEVSKFICRKLYRFFIYYKIDATVEATIIEPLAEIFRNNNYEIYPVLSTLLNSEHFFDAANTGCFIKTPVDHVMGTLRNFNLAISATTPNDQIVLQYYLRFLMEQQQMLPGDPPNVAGWPAFRQSPLYYRTWINSDTIRNRNIITDVLCFVGLASDNDKLIIDHVAFAAQFDNAEDPNQLVDQIVKLLLPYDLSPTKKFVLKTILLSGQFSDHYWTDAWNTYLNNPNDAMAYQTVWFRLASMHKYLMNQAEFQLA